MTMIESVAVRQRGGFDFETHYDNLCALQSSCPLPSVKAHLHDGIIDLNGDRIRAVDWIPILNTLRINKTLHLIAFRSYYQQTLEDQEKAGYPIKKKTPAIRCKEITYRLTRALKECLQVTPKLKCLEIQGLPLRERDLSGLAKGIAKNQTLQHLSLEYSRIGDEGLELLCRGLKNSLSVTSINLTGCSLTWKGADHIAKIIKHQATKRHNEAWQDSLRYRRPDLDRMPGIRRITLNTNPMLGDQGAKVLAEALKDDLWLKALDLQQCGVSEVGAKALLDVLKYNTTIVVLDVRQNPLIEQEMLHNIMEQVMINCNGQDTEYKWVKAEPLQDPMKPKARKKRTKTLQNSFGKKPGIKSAQRRRSRSAGSNSGKPVGVENVKPGPGMPWRTAQRANRYRFIATKPNVITSCDRLIGCGRDRGYPPEDQSPSKLYENITDISSSPQVSPGGTHVHIDYSSEEETSDTLHVYHGSKQLDSEGDHSSDRELKVELENYRRRFREEKNARAVAEERVIELSRQNQRLQTELEEFKMRRSILDDDRVLESIEASFKQFHAFLDLVRNAGLGQLITLAGIDQSQMAIPLSSPQRQSLGGRLSSSFIKPRKLDLTYTEPPAASPDRSFRPIQSSARGIHSPSAIDIHNPSFDDNGDLEALNHSRNLTMNTTTASSEGDISLPVRIKGLTYPHITPENFKGNSDPTLPKTGVIISTMKPKSRFDELYQKVLRDADGVLKKHAGDTLDSTGLSQSGLDQTYNASGDGTKIEKSLNMSKNSDQDQTKQSDSSAHSDNSDHSRRSQGSNRSSSRVPSQDTIVNRDQPKMAGADSLEKLGLNPDDLIQEHHSDKSKSDKSDLSDEDIIEDISIQNSPRKFRDSESDDDTF